EPAARYSQSPRSKVWLSIPRLPAPPPVRVGRSGSPHVRCLGAYPWPAHCWRAFLVVEHSVVSMNESMAGSAAAGGGVDINQLLQTTHDDKPTHPSGKRASCAKQRRRRKKEPQEVKPVILSRSKTLVHEKNKPVEPRRRAKSDVDDKKKEVTPELLSSTKPGIRKKCHNKKSNARGGGKGPSNSDAAEEQLSLLKQKLFEAERDLDKEKNTRTMLENMVKSLKNELNEVKQTLGEDKHFCIGTLKKELDYEQRLRISVQDDLAKSNDMIVSEQNRSRSLQKEMESEKKACESIKKEMGALREVLESERALHRSLQSDISSEKQKNEDLQKRVQCEVAVTAAIRMEMNSMKAKKGIDVDKERCMSCSCKAKAVKRYHATNESPVSTMKRPEAIHTRNDKEPDDERDRLLRRLRRELHDTRMKLKNERRKGAASVSRAKQIGPKRSMSDWVVAPTNRGQHAGLIPIIQSPSSVNMPRPIEASLPGSTCAAETSPPSPALPSLFHFEEDDVSIICDKYLEPLHDELTFIKSAYDPSEIIIADRKVTHILELTTGTDSETVSFAVTVSIPHNYPASGILGVKASIHDSNCSHEVRKCAVDALPLLEEVCTWEAKANEGREAIHPVFSVASGWGMTDWHNILSKELPLLRDSPKENETANEICVSLIHTHHIMEADKIQSIKKNASKLSLGGFIKTGKPAFILVEGFQDDCDSMLEALVHSKKVFQSLSFKFIGKVLRNVSDIESCRCLPRKMEQLESKHGFDKLRGICQELGLSDALNTISL
ncbi:hypothetical protein ACHAWF_007067, partial [Thalassiosira exigua]